jgi:citrate lyase subunit beta/citryl-CoA lyase
MMERPLWAWLYVPGDRPDRVQKALASDADAVILDLEDGCKISEKARARANVREALSRRREAGRVFARVNTPASEFAYDDLCAVVRPALDGILLPKIESAETMKTVDWLLDQLERSQGIAPKTVEIVPLVESALGITNAAAIAAATPRVKRMAFGAVDLALDLSIPGTPEEYELAPYRAMLVLASRVAGIEPPLDSVWVPVRDLDGLAASAARARAAGFGGKTIIHPTHIAGVRAGFAPTPAEVERARRVVDAFAAGAQGAIEVDGQLVDEPLYERARRVVAAAGATGSADTAAPNVAP